MPSKTMKWTQLYEPLEPTAEELRTAQRAAERERQHQEMLQTVRPLLRQVLGGWHHANPRFACEFNVEEFWPETADEPSFASMRITCHACNRRVAPFQTRSIISVDGGWRWVGLDHQEPYTDYFFACGWCGEPMLFTVYVPQ